MNQDQLAKILADHALYLAGDPAGVMADLRDADLRGAKLRYAKLRGVNLTGADLRYADLTGSDLRYATLRGVDLTGADLTGATLGKYVVGGGRAVTFDLAVYWALTTVDDRGVRWLKYSCETHTLDDWDRLAGELAMKHHPDEADVFERETRELVALCRTMDEVEQ
jgi:uncharacterized protein YjbI with pentapeptide repeats